jgi:hypothetical protein
LLATAKAFKNPRQLNADLADVETAARGEDYRSGLYGCLSRSAFNALPQAIT